MFFNLPNSKMFSFLNSQNKFRGKSIKDRLKSIKPLRKLIRKMKSTYTFIKTQDLFSKVTKIKNHGAISIRNYMIGKGNFIFLGNQTSLDNSCICIIGKNNISFNKHIPLFSLAVGIPARVVKQNVHWTRETLF